jgi:hypothetical protein
MSHDDSTFRIELAADTGLRIELEGTDGLSVDVPADTLQLQRVYVIAGPNDLAAGVERTEFRFWIEDLQSEARAYQDTTFSGREAE